MQSGPLQYHTSKMETNEVERLRGDFGSTSAQNIQSSTWQTLRFKPPEVPPTSTSPGWRIEFRPCEVQFTDFENAAISAFIVLLTRVILSLDLDFTIPMSKVESFLVDCECNYELIQMTLDFLEIKTAFLNYMLLPYKVWELDLENT